MSDAGVGKTLWHGRFSDGPADALMALAVTHRARVARRRFTERIGWCMEVLWCWVGIDWGSFNPEA